MYYVYRYIHPEYPWLYVGKTKNLKQRIKDHDTSNSDNIDRKYETLLKESSVYYIELENSAQMSMVELFLIDKYKPFLNKKDKYKNKSFFEIELPKWKRYIRRFDAEEYISYSRGKEKKELQNILIQEDAIVEKIKKAEIEIAKKEDILNSIIESLSNMEESIETMAEVSRKTKCCSTTKIYFSSSEIKEIYKNYPECKCTFYIDQYNNDGEKIQGILTDKDFKVIWHGNIVEETKRESPLFDIMAYRYVSKACKYYSKTPYPLFLLQKIYVKWKCEAEERLANTEKYLALSELDDGWYYDKFTDYQIYIENGEWNRVDLFDTKFIKMNKKEIRIQFVDSDSKICNITDEYELYTVLKDIDTKRWIKYKASVREKDSIVKDIHFYTEKIQEIKDKIKVA